MKTTESVDEFLAVNGQGDSMPLEEEQEQVQAADEEEETGETLTEFLHSLFVAEEHRAKHDAEVVANLGCTTMAAARVAGETEQAFNWAASQLAQIETPRPLVTSYEAICALAAATAENARYGLDQLAGKLGELETMLVGEEEVAAFCATATEDKGTDTKETAEAAAEVKLSKKERRAAKRALNKAQ